MTYDLNVILEPNLNEAQLGLEKDAIAAQIERVGGTITALDEWGNKRLAYPIRKLSEGYYLIYTLELPETASRQLSASLRLRDNVMRVLVTRDRPEQRTRKESRTEVRSESRPEPRPEARPEPRDETPAPATPVTPA